LAELLQDLMKETGSLDGTGFDGNDLDQLLADLQVPDFDPGTEDDQGKLDQLEPKWVACPHCGKEFDLREQA
jgi:hypothetical protein